MRRPALVLVAAALVGIAGGVGVAIARDHVSTGSRSALHAQATWSGKAAPPFALRDEAGRTVSLAQLRGRTVLLTFLDSRCRSSCPVEGGMLRELGRELGPRSGVELLTVSVDPWADTAASARAFAARARWTLPWHWLLGTQRELAPVWAAYGESVKRTKADILHTLLLYVIDRRGDQRAAYLFPLVPAQVAADVRTIAAA
jgi:protein SCO1/2